jgi:hypothetical protein
MEHLQLIYTIIISTLFCLGWNIITEKNNILYFIREPFELAIDNIEQYKNRKDVLLRFDNNNRKEIKYLNKMIFLNSICYYIGKPFVLCITCYGSLWGFSVFVALNGLYLDAIPHILINSIAVSFTNTFIYKLYAKLD